MQSRGVKGEVRSWGGGCLGEARRNRRAGGRTGDGASFRAAGGHRRGDQVAALLPDLHENTHKHNNNNTYTSAITKHAKLLRRFYVCLFCLVNVKLGDLYTSNKLTHIHTHTMASHTLMHANTVVAG